MYRYSKFKNTISHQVHKLKSSAANLMIAIPNKNLPGKCCGQRKKNTVLHLIKAVIKFYLHGMSKLGDHASFS